MTDAATQPPPTMGVEASAPPEAPAPAQAASDSLEDRLAFLVSRVAQQSMKVRQMKKDGLPVENEVAVLLELKAAKEAVQKEAAATMEQFDRDALSNVLTRRMFVVPSFEIHGGVAGLFDFGPPGVGLKDNIINEWKKHFILAESMLQVECPSLTPSVVLETSGHVARFTDNMVKDTKSGECFRADKLLEDFVENTLNDKKQVYTAEQKAELERYARLADSYSTDELDELFAKLNIVSPTTGGELSKSFPFNLMFATTIGPEGTARGFLRPETAQGIFVLFRRLLEYNNNKMPFAGAQIGQGYRNEISPRAGLLRVREFTMAEIEHFCHPERKEHPKFASVAHIEMQLFPASKQLTDGKLVTMTIGDAVGQRLVANETLGYFLARTKLFLTKIGVDPARLRFRQHLPTEMSHYAKDCWDAEIEMSYGWIECVGHADRSCYDLEEHSKASKIDLIAAEKLDEPIVEEYAKITLNKGKMGKLFRKDAPAVVAALEGLSKDQAMAFEQTLAESEDGKASLELADGRTVEVERDMVSWELDIRHIWEDKYTPSVIEPSFGIGRIVYAVLEHCFSVRDDEFEPESEEAKANADAAQEPKDKKQKKKGGDKEQDKSILKRNVFSFPTVVAPVKCGVGALQKKPEAMEEEAARIAQELLDADVASSYDPSGAAIGRKYVRCCACRS